MLDWVASLRDRDKKRSNNIGVRETDFELPTESGEQYGVRVWREKKGSELNRRERTPKRINKRKKITRASKTKKKKKKKKK